LILNLRRVDSPAGTIWPHVGAHPTVTAIIALPFQIIKTGRLLSWNRWLAVFFRGLRILWYPLRC
ncbi:MAG: hypothetical protein ACYTAO_24330, partial [Planctomycetota bacterium]